MDYLDFIVERAFKHEFEENRKSLREQMSAFANPEWIKEFAKRLKRLEKGGEREREQRFDLGILAGRDV